MEVEDGVCSIAGLMSHTGCVRYIVVLQTAAASLLLPW